MRGTLRAGAAAGQAPPVGTEERDPDRPEDALVAVPPRGAGRAGDGEPSPPPLLPFSGRIWVVGKLLTSGHFVSLPRRAPAAAPGGSGGAGGSSRGLVVAPRPPRGWGDFHPGSPRFPRAFRGLGGAGPVWTPAQPRVLPRSALWAGVPLGGPPALSCPLGSPAGLLAGGGALPTRAGAGSHSW